MLRKIAPGFMPDLAGLIEQNRTYVEDFAIMFIYEQALNKEVIPW